MDRIDGYCCGIMNFNRIIMNIAMKWLNIWLNNKLVVLLHDFKTKYYITLKIIIEKKNLPQIVFIY